MLDYWSPNDHAVMRFLSNPPKNCVRALFPKWKVHLPFLPYCFPPHRCPPRPPPPRPINSCCELVHLHDTHENQIIALVRLWSDKWMNERSSEYHRRLRTLIGIEELWLRSRWCDYVHTRVGVYLDKACAHAPHPQLLTATSIESLNFEKWKQLFFFVLKTVSAVH